MGPVSSRNLLGLVTPGSADERAYGVIAGDVGCHDLAVLVRTDCRVPLRRRVRRL